MTPETIDASLTDLHRRHRAELVAYARRLLGGDHATAEDLVQDAFLATHRALAADADRPLLTKPWLYRVVHNAAIDELRCARQHRAARGPLADRTGDNDPYTVLAERARLRETLGRVAALPPLQKDALLLHSVGGRDHRAVASALGISDGASRVLVHRARRTLRAA